MAQSLGPYNHAGVPEETPGSWLQISFSHCSHLGCEPTDRKSIDPPFSPYLSYKKLVNLKKNKNALKINTLVVLLENNILIGEKIGSYALKNICRWPGPYSLSHYLFSPWCSLAGSQNWQQIEESNPETQHSSGCSKSITIATVNAHSHFTF